MAEPLQILIIDDSDDDSYLLHRALTRGGLDAQCTRVETEDSFCAAVESQRWDLVLGDYALPGFGAEAAIRIIREKGFIVPFIVVSGVARTGDVVALLQMGAADFIEKADLERLAPSVTRTLQAHNERQTLLAAEQTVRDSEARYRQLVEMSPDGVLVHRDGIIVFANAAMAKILGAASPSDIVGRTAIEFVPPGDRDAVLARRATAASGQPTAYRETQYLRLDGQLIEVERAVATTTWEGQPAFLIVTRDVTERHRAAQALRDREAMLRRITDGVPAMINYGTRDGVIRFANKRYARWFGRSTDQVVGRHIREIRGEEAWQENLPLRAKVYAGESVTYEGTRVVDGEERQYRAKQIPHFDEDGKVQGHFALVLDITDERRTEQRLRESEERLRAILDNSPASIYLLDRDERFILANREFTSRFGMTESEILGKTAANVQPREVAEVYSRLNKEVLRTSRTVSHIHPHRRPDGEESINLVTKFPVRGGNGTPSAIGSIDTDITEITRSQEALRETESRFRDLIEESLQGIVIHVDGKPRYINAEFRRLFGYTAEEIDALPAIHDLLHPDDRARLIEFQNRRQAGADSPKAYEFRGIHKDGHPLHFYAKASLIDWYGEAATYVAMIDVTELKLIEEQLRQAQKMEAVGQLTGGIAHDFNNLMTVILGNLQLIEAMAPPESDTQPLARSAVRAVRRGAELTRRLLAFSRRQMLSPVPTDINGLIDGMHEMLDRALGETVTVAFRQAAGMRPVMIDETQMANALINIAINARDAMPAGGLLTIETAPVTLDDAFADLHPGVNAGDYAMITISDTGEGMTEAVRTQAFDPFFTTKDTGQGSGLGLSMVYGFVTQSGGFAEIDSEPGQGTSVCVYLPLAEPRDAATPGLEPWVRSVAGHETILVVEDDINVQHVATSLLDKLGYRTIGARDGRAALDILRARNDIDLLFTDVVLPEGMNGRQVADAAREIHPELRVLFTTGYAASGIIRGGGRDHDVALLQKPYTREALARMIRKTLDQD